MEILIVVFVILSLIGSISFLKPSKKMKALGAIRHIANKEGFKIGSTQILRKKFKSWTPQVAIYQIKNDSLLQSIQVYTLKINSFNEKEKNLINKIKTLENEKKKNYCPLCGYDQTALQLGVMPLAIFNLAL